MIKIRQKNGFGLIEVLIASTMIVMVLSAVTTLGIVSVRSSSVASDKAMAYNLAQEGIEAVRGMRDTSWVDTDPTTGWDFAWNDPDTMSLPKNNPTTSIQCGSAEPVCPVSGVYGLLNSGGKWYLSTDPAYKQVAITLSGAPAKFNRTVTISKVGWYDNGAGHIPASVIPRLTAGNSVQNNIIRKVEVLVSWTNDQGKVQSMTAVTYLSDWKMVE